LKDKYRASKNFIELYEQRVSFAKNAKRFKEERDARKYIVA